MSVPGSQLDKMFSGYHEIEERNGMIFLDRDPETFEFMINYLRNEREIYPVFTDPIQGQMFEKELDFWGVTTFNDELEEKRLRHRLPRDLIDLLMTEPDKAC